MYLTSFTSGPKQIKRSRSSFKIVMCFLFINLLHDAITSDQNGSHTHVAFDMMARNCFCTLSVFDQDFQMAIRPERLKNSIKMDSRIANKRNIFIRICEFSPTTRALIGPAKQWPCGFLEYRKKNI